MQEIISSDKEVGGWKILNTTGNQEIIF